MSSQSLENLLSILRSQDSVESNPTEDLLHEALDVLESFQDSTLRLSDVLQNLLATVLKPLFSSTQHPSLTSTGRKKLVSSPLLNSLPFSVEHDPRKSWKNAWTLPLLSWILSSYTLITPPSERKKALESHFPLLVPPILNTIDDSETAYKITGFHLTISLCRQLLACDADILSRTGLGPVFLDALKPNFWSVPAVTEEDESIRIMAVLYPAHLAVVAATTGQPSLLDCEAEDDDIDSPPAAPGPAPRAHSQTQPAPQPVNPSK